MSESVYPGVTIAGVNHLLKEKRSIVHLEWNDDFGRRLFLPVPFRVSLDDLRGPKGETWAGRGLRPTWLAALLKQGHKLEEYAVEKRVASRKKAPTKRSGKGRKRR